MNSAYKPFPDIAEWPKDGVDFSRIDRLREVSDDLATVDEEVLRRARGTVSRLAAIETGKIERLYDLDRGITINAAWDSAILEAAYRAKNEKAHALIESQIAAYDSVLDFATGQRPFAEAWIRELHAILCDKQDTYTAYDKDAKPVEVPLEKGKYKIQDNHVRTKSGVHHYAPFLQTAAEMERLIENVNSREFKALSVVDQSAYVHYAFVAIHPFPDGNGRVARALASIPTYRHLRVPLLITADQRENYFAALAAADEWRFNDLRMMVREQVVASVTFLERSVKRAKGMTPQEVSASIARNLVTRGGYSHVDVDSGGILLLTKLEDALNSIIGDAAVRPPGVKWSVSRQGAHRDIQSSEHRRVLSTSEQIVTLTGISQPPAEARSMLQINVEVPIDASSEDNYVLECGQKDGQPSLEVPVGEVLPVLQIMTEMSLALFAEDLMQYVGRGVEKGGRKSLVQNGFIRQK